ncbi:nucleoside phosphatase GDA1/CD39 [Ceraceosorus guamensis]|uniref:guanosine-diphosphatase n=1 Tax=Ceraceosorus guamensis TaxID=1522189 RepID=A0A316W2K1_9BASI|nr:nucleoside phosphatase GDA1/CD39 [Ceraceosorus guamensis]PWN44000.1 nucleoside phosphatase GDA1/CD39 [Ceraceosorus guamensis]
MGGDVLGNVRVPPEKHADPLRSRRCESNGGRIMDAKGHLRPTVQYGIMIDAGSTGSRVHVYKFNYCSSSPELESEVFEMIRGGLSSYGPNAQGAANSLRPLLQTAYKSVPPSLRRCTPISVKATAGLRLLGAKQSKDILNAVRYMLEHEYPFPIADGPDGRGKGVEIMEGRDEGVFAWITVNYLLNRIGVQGTNVAPKTAAVMDLGGASTQIVFEPTPGSGPMPPGAHVYTLEGFGGRNYTLYQNSYLGYGLMQARKSINALATFSHALSNPSAVKFGPSTGTAVIGVTAGADAVRIPSPCFAPGTEKKAKVVLPGRDGEVEVMLTGAPGGFAGCKRLVEVMMNKDAACATSPCSFAGVYQPSLMNSFADSPIVALSYFYDRLEPLGVNGTFSISLLESLAKDVCAGPARWSVRFPPSKYPEALKELRDRPETCLDLTFQHALLSLGYDLGANRQVTVAKKLAGSELGWCAGAQLMTLDEEGVLCKA